MGRSGSIKLAEVFGIRIGVSVSWFVILFLYIFGLSGYFQSALTGSNAIAYGVAVASALLLFVSVVLHELGHALIARRRGIQIVGIDLWFFGGLARMRREPETAGDELKIALAGPAVTVVIFAICAGVGVLVAGAGQLSDAASFAPRVGTSPGLLLLGWLTSVNALLFAFNMIPAFPLDGGRAARAIVWRLRGDREAGTRVAAQLGQAFAGLIGAGGILLALRGNYYGFYLLFLAFFVGQSARAELVRTAFSERLGGVRAADIMDSEPVSVPAALEVARALDEFFLRYRWSWFPTVDDDGRLVGIVRQAPVEEAVHRGDVNWPVRNVMDSDHREREVSAEAPLEALVRSEPLARLGALMAVDRTGVLRGVVTVEQVRRAVQGALGGAGGAA